VLPADRGRGRVFSSHFLVVSGGEGEREQKSERKEAGTGARVKFIKTKRLAKGSPPTRSERTGSSATLSAETAERVG
jgi:hypothetical protein